MRYEPSWNSLTNHVTPQWLKDAKFGIYTHWGVYSVPACRPNGTWYPFNMYREGTPQYEYHIKTYGHPSKFGYKDFIPMFGGERFDADEWADLFKKAGAKFAGPVGEHHDGFCMWNTSYSEWNAAKMGPKKDVVGELEKSIRKQGMKFMVALHHFENWFFYPHWKKDNDLSDPRCEGLYGKPHNLEWAKGEPKGDTFFLQDKPDKEFLDQWIGKTKEVIDNYRPDALWFDFGLSHVQEHYKRELMAYYYNKGEEWGRDVEVMYKSHDLVPGSGLIDLELGRFNQLTYNNWITDTTVDDGEGWCYLFDARYKSPKSLIHYLIDNVSKNGYLLLNVGPKPDGNIPDEAKNILLEIGKWLELNGEAIYNTTPWVTYGEGPVKMSKSGMFSEDEELNYTSRDIRFTAKDDVLYAICLDWPQQELVVESMKHSYPSEIKSVSMLGLDKKLSWTMTEKGLKIETPSEKPCKYAYVFKIERRRPF